MKYEEIPKGLRSEYKKECKCGKTHLILTQKDDFPEYDTEAYVLCNCGEFIEFILPVN